MKAFKSYPLSWRIQQMGAAAEKSRAHLRRRPRSAVDAENSRHPEAEKGARRRFFVIGETANPETRPREARIRAGQRNRQSHLHASGIRSDFEIAAADRVESHRAAAGKQPGREDHAFPPALRHRSPAGNRQRNPDAADSAVDGLRDHRRAHRSARLGRAEWRRLRRRRTRSFSA